MSQLKIISDFNHFFLFFKMVGHIHFPLQEERRKKHRNIFPQTYFIIFLCAFFYVQFISAKKVFSKEHVMDPNSHILNFVDKLIIICNFFAVLVSVIKSVTSSKQQYQILANIDLIDKHFESHFMTESSAWKYEINLIVFAYIFSYYLHLIIIKYFDSRTIDPANLLRIIFLSLVLRSSIAIYFFYVNLLKYRLQTTKIILVDLLNSPNFDRKIVINKILTIKRIYSLISDCAILVNNSLGSPIMFLFATVLLLLTKHLYLLFLDLEDGWKNLNDGNTFKIS